MYVYPSIDPDGCAHFIHNCNEFSVLQISECVINVKMFEIAKSQCRRQDLPFRDAELRDLNASGRKM